MKNRISPFSAMEKLTQTDRRSPLQKTLPDSLKSLFTSPIASSNTKTPKTIELNGVIDEVVPETPERQFGKELHNNTAETPCKIGSPEQKLITPFTVENKKILLSKLHRCKLLSVFEMLENSTPVRKENTLKRRALDESGNTTTKFVKTDENCSLPKARAALFQDKKPDIKLENFTLSTKSFYSNSDTKKDYKHFIVEVSKQKRHRRSFGGHTKRYSWSGVSHGIRKPKTKMNTDSGTKSNHNDSQENMNDHDDFSQTENMEEPSSPSQIMEERSSSPEISLSNRFFKTKKSSMRNYSAKITINNNIKLKVTPDGKVALNRRNTKSVTHARTRAKLMDVSFDTTDLTVDEPEIETVIEQNQVSDILKILEDDWSNDDYDTMEILTSRKYKHITPLKPVAVFNDIPMSPTSELSHMTSIMNIEDISKPVSCKDISFDKNKNSVKEKSVHEQKYYPLFNKGYSSNKVMQEIGKKTTHKEYKNWQLSAKQNGDDNQYQLDAGQRNFGATQCTECGVVYQIGDPEDENAHLNYHNNKKTLKFPGWKTERVIMEDTFTSSRIISVEPGDPKQCWNKIRDVLAYVDKDLGLADITTLSDYEHKNVYLYVRDKTILGVLVAERIKTAHRMIPELLELDCCTAESSPAKCGINVVWTDMNHRKQGIATKLIDILRIKFYYGYVMSLDDIAFSIPSQSGKIFAQKYTKTRNFKVYS